jgi:isopentenyl diphosphate isomerase/L-lactate dehydrogenase-like FMN-dependent dehydrogenase
VLKLLALGADAVLVGRPLIIAAFGGGRDGVAMYLKQMQNELLQAMLLTGCADVRNVSSEIVYTD